MCFKDYGLNPPKLCHHLETSLPETAEPAESTERLQMVQ